MVELEQMIRTGRRTVGKAEVIGPIFSLRFPQMQLSFNVQRARDHTLDTKAFADTTNKWKASEAQVFDVVERDVLFQQQVTRNTIL